MNDEPPKNPPPVPPKLVRGPDDYRIARIATAIGLTFVTGILLFLDAISTEYSLSEVTLTALLATILTLLGAEVLSSLRSRL